MDLVHRGAGIGGEPMPIDTKGFSELIGDISRMAAALDTANEGAPAARRILTGPRAYAVVGRKAEKYLQYMK